MPNKSLDASGGSVFLNLLGAAQRALIRAAASTLTLYSFEETAMKQIFSSAEFWKFALPLSGAVIAWFVNEWRKRLWEQYQRKEASYKQLVHCLKGFYVGAAEADRLKAEFLDQLNQCWLYCPDEVIKKGYGFLDTVHTDRQVPDETKERALGDFVASIRRDLLARKLLKKTDLSEKDFRHLKVNK